MQWEWSRLRLFSLDHSNFYNLDRGFSMKLRIFWYLTSIFSGLGLTMLFTLSTEAAELTSGQLFFQGESRAPTFNSMFAEFKNYPIPDIPDDDSNIYAPFGNYGEFEITDALGGFSSLSTGFNADYEILSVGQFSDLLSLPFMKFPLQSMTGQFFVDPDSLFSETTPDGIITETTAAGFLVGEESTPVFFELTETAVESIEGGTRIEYQGILTVSSIPEPNSTLGLLAIGIGTVGSAFGSKKTKNGQ